MINIKRDQKNDEKQRFLYTNDLKQQSHYSYIEFFMKLSK